MITSSRSRDTYQRVVRYRGAREHLVAAGLIGADQLPPPGETRRFGGERGTPSYFSVTVRGDVWIVTRWLYWRAPELVCSAPGAQA